MILAVTRAGPAPRQVVARGCGRGRRRAAAATRDRSPGCPPRRRRRRARRGRGATYTMVTVCPRGSRAGSEYTPSRLAERDLEPRFLARLAHCRLLDGLADVDEAARQRVPGRRMCRAGSARSAGRAVLQLDHDVDRDFRRRGRGIRRRSGAAARDRRGSGAGRGTGAGSARSPSPSCRRSSPCRPRGTAGPASAAGRARRRCRGR